MSLCFIKIDINGISWEFLSFFLGGYGKAVHVTANEDHWGIPWNGPNRLQRVTGIWPHLLLAGYKQWVVSTAFMEACDGVPHLVFRPTVIDKLVEYDELEKLEVSQDILELWGDVPTIYDWMDEHEHRPDLMPRGVYYHEMFVPRLVQDIVPGLAALRDEGKVTLEGGICFSEAALAFCREHRRLLEQYPIMEYGTCLIMQESVFCRLESFIDQRVFAVGRQEF